MPVKKLFILANSIKKNHRCVAGREIVKTADGKERWGAWIRPVTTHDEGAISLSECSLQDNCIPEPLDVVEIPCLECEEDPAQPENWEIQTKSRWNKICRWTIDDAAKLIEDPPNLWLEPGVKQDRVSPRFLHSLRNHQSLYLIKPINFQFLIETNYRTGRKRSRGVFTYNRNRYDFSMTDPIIGQRYFPNINRCEEGFVELLNPDKTFICVSLTPELNGYHYKIVAAVFEP